MHDFLYKNFNIDVGEIWLEELAHFESNGANKAFYDDLYHYLQPFYLKKGNQPFISKLDALEDAGSKGYYDNYYIRLKRKSERPLDFFEHDGAFYDMNAHCVVAFSDVSEGDFKRLFSLKLRHFEDEFFYLYPFLTHHLQRSFSRNDENFYEFLKETSIQYTTLIPASVLKGLNCWIKDHETTLNQKRLQEYLRRHKRRNADVPESSITEEPNAGVYVKDLEQETQESLDSEKSRNVQHEAKFSHIAESEKADATPANNGNSQYSTRSESVYDITVETEKDTPIGGTFSNDEILHFFSFLFRENSEIDGSFLSKEAFDHVFKNGLKIPSVQPIKKYTLHFTRRFPKKIVDYFIYSFIDKYNYSMKRDILIFFGSYIRDYEKALDALTYQGVSKNITGESPKNMKYSLTGYLPERFS